MAAGGAPRLVTDPVSNYLHYYDPTEDTWAVLTRMKEPRHHHAGIYIYIYMYRYNVYRYTGVLAGIISSSGVIIHWHTC